MMVPRSACRAWTGSSWRSFSPGEPRRGIDGKKSGGSVNEFELEIFEQTSDYSEFRLCEGEKLRNRGLNRAVSTS